MQQITALLAQHGLAFVFVNVFLVQAGAPVPAVPTLIVAGAFAVGGSMSLPAILGFAVVASLLGDFIWYVFGRIYGIRVLRLLCRVSISPDSCVRETEDRFLRWGAPSLMFAKFVPGFATVAPPLAGASRVRLMPFLFFSAISAALWAGAAAGAGMIFASQIEWLFTELEKMGVYALVLIGIALALFVAYKWWQRRSFFQALRMARISVDDLYRMMESGASPLVVDVRSAGARSLDPRGIPRAIVIDLDNVDEALPHLPLEQDIILYCT